MWSAGFRLSCVAGCNSGRLGLRNLSTDISEFPEIRVPYFGVLITRILLFEGTILGSPIFGNSHIS